MQTSKSTLAFECQVCYERYNDAKHLPKSLPCGHSCCLQCTKELFGRKNSITCPICRKVTNIQPTSLATNYGILDALPSAAVQPRVTMCPKHVNKSLELYCSNCRVCVCTSCFVKDHKGHEVMEIPDDALTEMKSSCSVLSRLDVVCGEIALAVSHLNEVEINLETKEIDIAASIHESFNQIRAAVDAREEALISSLSSKRLAVTSHKHQLESFLSDIQTSTQSFRDLLQSSDVVQFQSSRESIVPVLSRLDEEMKSTDFRVNYDNRLSLACNFVSMIRSINRLVQLDTSNEMSKPCRNELESQMTVIDILKQTRGELNWNGPDNYGNVFHWSEEMPLGEWDGNAPNWYPAQKRVQANGNGHITGLLLHHLGMRGILPVCISNLTSLTDLVLRNNQLTLIPHCIGNLTSLTCLYVSNNQLTHLPDTIGNLASLTQLLVDNNQLTHLPDTIGNLAALTTLYVDNNQLTHLPDTIGNLVSLTTLHLSNNQLTHLPDTIGSLSSLADLSVHNNQLTHLPDSIVNLTSLTTLYIYDNPITSTQAGKDEVMMMFNLSDLEIVI